MKFKTGKFPKIQICDLYFSRKKLWKKLLEKTENNEFKTGKIAKNPDF